MVFQEESGLGIVSASSIGSVEMMIYVHFLIRVTI